jgi:FMN phosphatase YigB (HAD superfamily)
MMRSKQEINGMGAADTVFLLDVDNTLIDNDAIQAELSTHLEATFGAACRDRYWAIFEELRAGLGYADYLGALQKYRLETDSDHQLLLMSSFLIDYPFARRLYPGAFAAIRHCQERGPTAILSDGDVVFQPRKIERSGLWRALNGNVLVYVHKELALASVERLFPARRYVMVDDKLRILAAMKQVWDKRLTTVFVRQGHYAHSAAETANYPPADLTIETIGDLRALELARLGGHE